MVIDMIFVMQIYESYQEGIKKVELK